MTTKLAKPARPRPPAGCASSRLALIGRLPSDVPAIDIAIDATLEFDVPPRPRWAEARGGATLHAPRTDRRRIGLALASILSFTSCQSGAEPDSFTEWASLYEEMYVPALFAPWAARVADAAEPAPGDRWLDVACGTGVVAREARRRMGRADRIVGLDISPGMLAVARRIAPEITWQLGDAQDLPFADESFDVVTCQFGLMFFPDRVGAIREMLRVTRPGGRIVVAVWGPLAACPGFHALEELLERQLGPTDNELFRTPFSLGDADALAQAFADAGATGARTTTHQEPARFASLRSWLESEVAGWVPADRPLGEAELEQLVSVARRELAQWIRPDGAVRFPMQAHLVRVTR